MKTVVYRGRRTSAPRRSPESYTDDDRTFVEGVPVEVPDELAKRLVKVKTHVFAIVEAKDDDAE